VTAQRLAVLVTAALLGMSAVAHAQSADLHELQWYIHIDMITGTEPLSFWEGFIDEATAESEILLKGNQGSTSFTDTACCSELTKASAGTYGTTGDGLDTPTSSQIPSMRSAIQGGDPGGSVAFLVRDIALCGTSSTATGCGVRPSCNSNANDDPDLWLMLGVDGMQDDDDDFIPEGIGGMAQSLSHERGHNSCLSHVSGDSCQLMAPFGDGGCLSATECTDIQEGRTTTSHGDPCDCLTGGGGVEADGVTCTEGATVGICSGGVCSTSGGQVQLLVAAAPEDNEISAPLDETTDDLLRLSDVSGGGPDIADFADSIQGLAYDADRDVLWGVLDNGANDQIVQIDPGTGSVDSVLATLTGHPNVIALAFHPGPTSAGSDDHLLANSAEAEANCDLVLSPPDFCSGDLIEIDPVTGDFFKVGDLAFSFVGGLRGMAYDSDNDILYGTAFAGGGLWKFTDLSCNTTLCSCAGSCNLAEEAAVDLLPRVVSGLAYSAHSNRLYVLGSQAGPRLLYNTVDADTLTTTTLVSIADHTVGGAAAVPLPEPSGAAGWVAGIATLAGLARRRRTRGRERR